MSDEQDPKQFTRNIVKTQMDADERNLEELLTKLAKAERKGNRQKAERIIQQLDEYPSEVGQTVIMNIGFAGGGPTTGLEVEVSWYGLDWGVDRVIFEGSYGGEVIRKHVPKSSSLYRYAERVAETWSLIHPEDDR